VSWALVTNDDGIAAPGLHALAAAAVGHGIRVVVAAPVEQASGSGASMIATMDAEQRVPVRREQLPGLDGVEAYAVAAQPAFITYAALNGWFSEPPSLVLSGINEGPNLGRAVLHSGTVGAALTAGRFGARALAVSLDSDALRPGIEPNWDIAVSLVPEVLAVLTETPPGTVFSLNVPDVAPEELGELTAAPLAELGKMRTRVDGLDGGYLGVRSLAPNTEGELDTDISLLAAGHPTLTAVSGVTEDAGIPLAVLLAERARR
jgi:5'-nucleotidase